MKQTEAGFYSAFDLTFITMKTLTILSVLFLFSIGVNAQDFEFMLWKGATQSVISQLEPEFKKGTLDAGKSVILARAYRTEDKVQEALEVLGNLPEDSVVLSDKAECLISLGNYIDATAILEKVYHNEPDNLKNAVKLGKTYLNIKENRRAADVFEKLAESDTTNVFYLRNYALACHRSGQKNKATEMYKKVLMLNKRDFSSIVNLASIYQADNEFEKAISVIAMGKYHFRNNMFLKKKFAELYFLNKNYGAAESLYSRILESDSSYVVRKNYAICLYFNKGYEESLEYFDKLIYENPNDPFVAFYYGLSLKRLERYEESEELIKSAISIGTPYYLAGFYHHLADNYRKREMYKECIECYKKVLELDVTNSEVYLDLATLYEEYNSNNTVALGYYKEYLKNCDDCDEKKVNYASERIKRLKEELFMNE